jgi:hypothetical protein
MSLPAAADAPETVAPVEPSPASVRRPPALERFGARYLSTRARRAPAAAAPTAWAVEQAAYERLRFWAVARAAASGVVSSVTIGSAELCANAWYDGEENRLRWWGLVVSATLVVAVCEILFLFWNALDATSRVARLTGVEDWLSPRPGVPVQLDRPLARAALELPNPRDGHPGVDPLREASRTALLVATVLYKAKVAASTFVLKQVVKRILSRATVRSLLPFVAIPVTATWNAIVTARIVRQARIRALGPRAVQQAVSLVFEHGPPSTPVAQLALVRAVAAGIVRTRDLHPNLELFLAEVRRRCPVSPDEPLDCPRRFLDMLERLPPAEQDRALLALGLAAALDGRVSRRERALLAAAAGAARRSPDFARWERMARAVVEGDGLRPDGP